MHQPGSIFKTQEEAVITAKADLEANDNKNYVFIHQEYQTQEWYLDLQREFATYDARGMTYYCAMFIVVRKGQEVLPCKSSRQPGDLTFYKGKVSETLEVDAPTQTTSSRYRTDLGKMRIDTFKKTYERQGYHVLEYDIGSKSAKVRPPEKKPEFGVPIQVEPIKVAVAAGEQATLF